VSAPEDFASLAGDVADSLGHQLDLHVELGKAELARETERIGRDALWLALGLGPAILGCCLLSVGLGLALAPWTGAGLAFGLVGGAELVFGGLIVKLRLRRMFPPTIAA
jgi:hypothetical protein